MNLNSASSHGHRTAGARLQSYALAVRSAPAIRITTSHCRQRGIGLIEVMSALLIFAIGALAVGNMQGTAITNVKTSESHFAINSLGEEIAEHLKASAVEAGAGNLNTEFAETVVSSSVPAAHAGYINGWKNRVFDTLPQGQSRIACVVDSCDVSLQWRGAGVAGVSTQTYNLKFPLPDN